MIVETCQGKKVVAVEVDHKILRLILEGKDLLCSFVRELKSRENSVLCSHMADLDPRAPSTPPPPHTHITRSSSGLPEPNFQEGSWKIVENHQARSTTGKTMSSKPS